MLQEVGTVLLELLVLPVLSPPPLSDGMTVCVVSVFTTDVSPSDFGVMPIPEDKAATPPAPAAAMLLVVDCRAQAEQNKTFDICKWLKTRQTKGS